MTNLQSLIPNLHAKRLISRLSPSLLSLTLLLYFWANGLTNLDRFPKIHEDESWQAAPGYTFWAEGRFGTDLFAGFYGMEEHYYGFMPLFPIMVGAALHLFGLGLFQARLVPLSLIVLTLALTHRLGAKLFSPWHGTVAVAVLVGWRIAEPFAHLVNGIPLADLARIVRYDSAVPVFGLSALLVLMSILSTNAISPRFPRASWPFIVIGSLTGLATLSHLYGAFWLPALLVVMVWLRGRRALKPALLAGLGFLLTLIPWVLFVASGWTDFVNQYRNYGSRFGLLDLRFYAINLLTEIERYEPIFNGARQSLGVWLWLIIGGLSLGWLAYRALWRSDRPARVLIATPVTLSSLFALLLSFKTFSYLATLWPLMALVTAAGFIYAWQAQTQRWWWRPLLTLLFCLALLEGVLTNWQMQQAAQQLTSYQTFTQYIAAELPPRSRVMGLQHYWLGLSQNSRTYHSLLVPIFWTHPQYVAEPIPFEQAAQAIPADVILLDQIMLDFLADVTPPDNPLHSLGADIQDYLEQQQAELITEIDDPTYGRVRLYQLEASGP